MHLTDARLVWRYYSRMIEIYSSIECPFAYLAAHRLRRVWPEYAGRCDCLARSLEYINGRGPSSPSSSWSSTFSNRWSRSARSELEPTGVGSGR